ncbi:hypothetical protein [Sansalvadorimonas verongulae]|uniref:hypothetical protein n=1 Tax=Sansalvadorimonas verongulae TaxID=2172824 RepID=UPI0012BC19AD|nr:hypothetical protein [Sansalvadorimonas verongulae]MTI14074.1 hypothetical protein [Sansalvadorimonas verongulae]
MEQRVIPINYLNKLEEGYLIGPMETEEVQAPITLEMKFYKEGIAVLLRVAPGEKPSYTDMVEKTVLTGLYLSKKGSRYTLQHLNSDVIPVGDIVEIPTTHKQTEAKLALMPSDEKALLPDPIAIANYLINWHKARTDEGTHDSIKTLLGDGSEEGQAIAALDRLYSEQTDPSTLLIYTPARRFDFIQKDDYMILPVHSFASALSPFPAELHAVKPPPTRINKTPKAITKIYFRHDMPDLGVLTPPMFIEGAGEMFISREDNTVARGGQYFFQIKEDNTTGGMVVALHRLHRSTVEESAEFLPDERGPLFLYLDNNGATLTDQSGQNHGHTEFFRPVSKFEATISFKRKLKYINYVLLANLMSEWVDFLQDPDNTAPPVLDEKAVRECFNGRFTPTESLKPTIFFGAPPVMKDLNMGFKGSHLHTSILAHPQIPASGFETMALSLKDELGYRANYFLRLHQVSSQSYVASLHEQDKKRTLKDIDDDQAWLALSGQSSALATLYVEYIGKDKMYVRLTDRNDSAIIARPMATNWNPDVDKISLLPLNLPADEQSNTRIHLPGIALCTNLLAHVTTGRIKGTIDTDLLPHLTHPQASADMSDPNGAYKSAILREKSVVPHYRNFLSRQALGLFKEPIRIVRKHPGKSALIGSGIALGASGLAWMYPEQAYAAYTTTMTATTNAAAFLLSLGTSAVDYSKSKLGYNANTDGEGANGEIEVNDSETVTPDVQTPPLIDDPDSLSYGVNGSDMLSFGSSEQPAPKASPANTDGEGANGESGVNDSETVTPDVQAPPLVDDPDSLPYDPYEQYEPYDSGILPSGPSEQPVPKPAPAPTEPQQDPVTPDVQAPPTVDESDNLPYGVDYSDILPFGSSEQPVPKPLPASSEPQQDPITHTAPSTSKGDNGIPAVPGHTDTMKGE